MMFTPVKNKKRLSTFALLGVFMIFSMLVTSTVEAQTLRNGQTTETLAIASPDFTDTVGDGLPLTTEEEGPPAPDGITENPEGSPTPGGDPTADPSDVPTGESTIDPTEDPETEQTQNQTETQAPEGTATEDPKKTETESTEETDPGEETDPLETSGPTDDASETPSPEPGKTEEPQSSDTATAEPEETEEFGDGTETPEATETEGPELSLSRDSTESDDRGLIHPDIRVSISSSGNACGPNMTLSISVKNQNWILNASDVQVSVSIKSGGGYIASPSFPQSLEFGDIPAGETKTATIDFTTNVAWEEASHNSEIKFKAYIDQPTPEKENKRLNTVQIKKPNNCTSNTCPQDGNWDKVDGINALTYEYTAPEGFLVDKVCYKAGTTKTTYDVNPDESPHTVTSSVLNPQGNNYQKISHASFELVEEQKQAISLDWDCVTEGEHGGQTKWTVYNPNNMKVSFNWQSNVNPVDQQGSGEVSPNSSTPFYTSGDSQTVVVTYYYADGQARCGEGRCVQPVTYDIDKTSDECKIALDLQITVSCLENGDHQWTVTNPNSESISFHWVSNNGEDSGDETVSGNDGSIQFTSNHEAQVITLTYDYGAATGLSSSASTTEVCWVPQPLAIDVSCLPNGDHQWTVTNPNPVDIVFDWSSDNGLDAGQDLTAPMNSGTKQFTSNHEAQEVIVTYDYAGVTGREVGKTTQEVCWLPQDLIISVECLDSGEHKWTVQNPNPHAISFDWETDESPSALQSGGPITVPAKSGGTYGRVTFTTDQTMHTVKVLYDYTQASIFNKVVSEATTKVCTVHLQIEPVCSFPGADNLVWKVINNNSFDVSYSYVLNGNYLSPITGNVAHPGVNYIETEKWVMNVEIFEGFHKVDSAAPTDPCYVDLTLDYDCLDDGDHEWTITNPNNSQAVSYRWKVNNGSFSNWVPIEALSEDVFTVTGTSGHLVTVEYKIDLGNGTALKDSDSKLAGVCVVIEPPTVDSQCVVVDDIMKHKWTIHNPNNYWIWYKWASTSGESEGAYHLLFGDNNCNDCDNDVFYTDHTDQILTIFYKKHALSEVHSFTVEAEDCISAPTLTASCSVDKDKHVWTVDNTSNPVPIDFSWTSNASPAGGNDTAPASGAKTFETIENGAQQSVTLTYTYQGESITLNPVTDEACDVVDLEISISTEDESCDDFEFDITVTNTASFLTAHNVSLDAVIESSDLGYVESSTLEDSDLGDIGPGQSVTKTFSIITKDSTWKIAPSGTDIYFEITADSDETDEFEKQGKGVNPGECDIVALDIRISTEADSCDDFEFEITVTNTASFLTANNVVLGSSIDSSDQIYVENSTLEETNLGDIGPGQSVTKTFSITTLDSTWKSAPASTAIDFTITADSDGTGPVSETGSAVTPGNCSVEPVIDYKCQDYDNSHIWSVENTNPFTIEIQWKIEGEANFNDTWLPILTGETIELAPTTSAPHAIVVKYRYGSEAEIEMAPSQTAEECKISGLDLSFICGYPTDTELYWQVENPFDFAFYFTWEVEGSDPLETGTETIDALGSVNFATSLGDKNVILYVNGNEVDQAESGETCYEDLELDFMCLPTGLHEWTVTNNNTFDQPFIWSSTNGEAGDGTVEKNGGTATFTTGVELQTVTVSYEHEIFEKTVETLAEACKAPELDLVYDCGYPTDSVLYWYVSNPLDVDIDFDWEVVGSTEKGSGKALANDDTYFTTSTGTKRVKIMVEGYDIDEEDGGESCMVELSLSFNCLDNGNQEWTVTNLNKDDQAFDWSSDSGASGSGIAPAGGSFTFTTANIDQQITIEYKHNPFPAQSTTAFGEVCKLSTPEPPTTYGVSSEIGTCQEWIVFHTMRDGNMEVYRLDGIEGVGDFELFNLSKGDGTDSRPSRSFNDAWVAFQSNRDGNYEIYYGDTAGSQQVRLTDNDAYDINPIFSPDNTHIVFQSNRNGNWDLYLVNRLTGEETQLTNAESDETNPFFSNNQNFLVFETNKNGNQDIYLFNIVTGDEYPIVSSEADELSPALSPNGQKVAFLSPVDGVMQLFVIDIDGSNKTQITDGDGDTNHHAWSPDSTRLAYQSIREDNLDIYSYDLRDNAEYRVTDDEVDDIGPTWDCGGVNLSFTSTSASDDLNIYQVYWKGGASSQMTIDPATDKWSEWSPAKETASRGN